MPILNCEKCKQFLFDEHQAAIHICEYSWLYDGNVEECKHKMYHFYDSEYRQKRIELFERFFPLHTYQAMKELGDGIAGLPQIFNARVSMVNETTIEAPKEAQKQREEMLSEQIAKLNTIKTIIWCNNCPNMAKFYCCDIGNFCSSECRAMYPSCCRKKLKEPAPSNPDPEKQMPELFIEEELLEGSSP